MRLLSFLFSLIIISSCSNSGAGPKYDLKGYETENLGDGGVIATYHDSEGNLLATGTVLNGVRNGTWITYHPNSSKIKTITNYINGKINGIVLNLNDRGQIEAMSNYKNDKLHGLKASYRFGRAMDETTYKDGQIDGPFAIYNIDGTIQKRGEMKNGKQHGKLQFFDDKGNMTVEYTYDNGQKVSGGIIDSANKVEE